MPSRIVYFFQIQLDGLGQVGQGFVNCVTLAGHVNLQALRDKPVLFLVQRCGQRTRRVRHGTRIATRRPGDPQAAGPERELLRPASAREIGFAEHLPSALDPVARAVSLLCGRSATPMWSMSALLCARGSGTCMLSPPIQGICAQLMTPSSCTCREGTVGQGETARLLALGHLGFPPLIAGDS